MNMTRPLLRALLLLAALAWHPMASAQADYSEAGADTCLKCHDEDEFAYSASAIFKSRHGQRGDKRALLETVTRNAKEEFTRHRMKRASDHNTRSRALTDSSRPASL